VAVTLPRDVQAQSKLAEIRVSKLAANIVGTLLTILFCVIAVLVAHMLPHHARFAEWHGIAFIVSCVVLLPVHEALHAAGLRIFAGVPLRHIKFGVMWRAMMPYCHCTVPISVHAYRRMALLPLWITGSLSVGSLLAFPADWLGVFTGFAVAACVGDVWMVIKLRSFADTLLVRDSPSEIGCDVLSTTTETAA
jgi:Putative zincin peptidase